MQFTAKSAKLLSIQEPELWPDPPSRMSVSLLRELESCPKRWALNSANYPQLWELYGYPRPLNLAALEGIVIHSVIELIVREMSVGNCSTLEDRNAIDVMRRLGGNTGIIKNSIEGALDSYLCNPRSSHKLAEANHRLINRTAEIRSLIQMHLSRIRFVSSSPLSGSSKHNRGLSNGCYTEVELRARELGWLGITDLLTISDDYCEIRDFKTGVPKEQHCFQLQVYALLWQQDFDLNPAGRLIDRLIISYNNREVEISAPGFEELMSLRDELLKRTEAVIRSARTLPPQAFPEKGKCPCCSVRHLCNDYWNLQRQSQILQKGPQGQVFSDLQIRLIRRHGPTSWDGEIEICPVLVPGETVLLRMPSFSTIDVESGMRVRILDALIKTPLPETSISQAQKSVATLGDYSEVFTL